MEVKDLHKLWSAINISLREAPLSLPSPTGTSLQKSWVSAMQNHLGSKCIMLPAFHLMVTLSPRFKTQRGSPTQLSLSSHSLLPSSWLHFLLWAPHETHNSLHCFLSLSITFLAYIPSSPSESVSSPRRESLWFNLYPRHLARNWSSGTSFWTNTYDCVITIIRIIRFF